VSLSVEQAVELREETRRMKDLGKIATASIITYDQRVQTFRTAFQTFRTKSKSGSEVTAENLMEFLDAMGAYMESAEKHTSLLASLIKEVQDVHTKKLEKFCEVAN